MPSQPQRGEVVVDGKRLETLLIEAQQPERPSIVLLHEGLGSIELWKAFPQLLAARTGCAVLAYSRYGHGGSDKLQEKRRPDFMHHEGAVVLPELLDKLGIEQPVLLGHSDGGSIAIILAATYPAIPRALILEAPHVFVEDLSIASITQAKVIYETTDFGKKLARYHQHVDATFWGWNDIWLDPQFRAWNIEPFLSAIRCAILCLQGEQDEYGTSAQLRAIQAQAPDAKVVMLPDCRHSPHRDQEQAVLDHVGNFLDTVLDGAATTVSTIDSSPRG